MEKVLELRNIDLYAPQGDGIRKVISGYSLTLNKGEIRTVTAESREETHLLYGIVTGDRESTAGKVNRAEGTVGKIRRGSEAFAELQVHENLALALGGRYRKGAAREYGFDPREETSRLGRADRVRLMFAQRYLQEPVYIAAENPFEDLEEPEILQVMNFLREEAGRTGIPVLIIETTEKKRDKIGDMTCPQ